MRRLVANAYVTKPSDFHDFRAAIVRLGHFWSGCNLSSPPLRVTETAQLTTFERSENVEILSLRW